MMRNLMRNQLKYNLLFFIGVLTLFGCATQSVNSDKLEQLSFETIAHNRGLKIEVKNLSYQAFFKSQEWSEFWEKTFTGERPSVDFSKYFVLCVFQGLKKTGGYSINIDQVELAEKESTLHVSLKLKEPDSGEPVDLGETNPSIIAKTGRPETFPEKFDPSSLRMSFYRLDNSTRIKIQVYALN